MLRYFIKTFGCKVNQVESDELNTALKDRGAQSVECVDSADFIIVNTCTVTGEADRKVRKELRRYLRLTATGAIIVTGCTAVLRKAELEALGSKIKVFADKNEILEYVQNISNKKSEIPSYTPNQSSDFDDVDSAEIQTSNLVPSTMTQRIRIPLKVQDGCESFCSYCIVPYARGLCNSVPADDIIKRAQSLVAVGTKEIILTGINLGNYCDTGTDKDSGTKNLAQLIRQIQEETDLHRLRLSSIEPLHVTDDLLELLAEGTLLCEHLHIPLQSGSDYVLGEMNRNYSTSEYLEVVEKIRKANPKTAITTDIIVAYPSEDDDDFGQTMKLVKEVGFAKIHVFRYSTREGTAAAKLKPLDPRLVKERAKRLQKQADMDALRYLNSRKGSRLELVVEDVNGDDRTIIGTSREYLRLELSADALNLDGRSEGKSLKPGELIHTIL